MLPNACVWVTNPTLALAHPILKETFIPKVKTMLPNGYVWVVRSRLALVHPLLTELIL